MKTVAVGTDADQEQGNKTMHTMKPTSEQLAALTAYATQHGRDWKTTLGDAWMTGRYDSATVRREHDGLLQQLRNQCGPSWLRAATVLVEVAR